MSVTLTPQAEARIRQKVEAGPYRTPDEVVEEALGLLDERDRRLDALRAKIRVGLDQLDRGEGIELTPALWDEIDREVDERLRRGDRPNPDVCP
jgi:antitoxin ParD1/3/4